MSHNPDRVNYRTVLIAAALSLVMASGVTWAAQTNYLGTVFIADPTVPTRQMTVNADGSINTVTSGTPSGTQDVNITKVGGNVVTTAVPVSGTVIATPGTGTFTNRSGTVATGGTSQTLAVANSTRMRLIIENPCAQTESLFFNFTTAASTSAGSSIELAPCGSYDSAGAPVSTEAITVTAATSAHPFIAKEM